MLPLSFETNRRTVPLCTILLITITAGTFLLQVRRQVPSTGFIPLEFAHGLVHPSRQTLRELGGLALSLFIHGSLFHLVSNLWFLWLFGGAVERKIGRRPFIAAYVVCGVAAMLSQGISDPFSPVPVVGASGAIAGIMGISLLALPLARILVWIPPLFFIRLPSFIFFLVWLGIQYLHVYGREPGTGGIAWWAHIGGFFAGVVWYGAASVLRPTAGGRRGGNRTSRRKNRE